ncbi:MAG: ribosome silencing factor [Bacteroidetes bacterium]|nr:ribosome silencing factor [Bacteroidota bacterium]
MKVSKKVKPAINFNSTIVKAIQEKKGEDIVILDLRKIEDSVCDYFIICHADSNIQVRAIADEVTYFVKEKKKERPWHKEGYQTLEWVLLDYVDVVVHIFNKERRSFYDLEDLWSDAKIKSVKSA